MESTWRCNPAIDFTFPLVYLVTFHVHVNILSSQRPSRCWEMLLGRRVCSLSCSSSAGGQSARPRAALTAGSGARPRLTTTRTSGTASVLPQVRCLLLPAPLSMPLAKQHQQNRIVFIITHDLQECILVYMMHCRVLQLTRQENNV